MAELDYPRTTGPIIRDAVTSTSTSKMNHYAIYSRAGTTGAGVGEGINVSSISNHNLSKLDTISSVNMNSANNIGDSINSSAGPVTSIGLRNNSTNSQQIYNTISTISQV